MLKSLHKKNIICFAACAALMLTFASCDVMSDVFSQLGSSQEAAISQSADTDSANAETEDNTDETTENTKSEESQETTEEPTDEAGGNPDDSGYFSVEITVLEDKYIYDNKEISYDELLELFDTLTEGDVVQFRDENAALDTYQQATSALDDRGISYIHAMADQPLQ